MKHYAQTTRVDVLTVETTAPPAWVADALHIGRAEHAVHAVRLRSVHTTPVMLTDAWVPESLGAHITARALKKQALYEILMDQGVVFGRVLQQIGAEAAIPRRPPCSSARSARRWSACGGCCTTARAGRFSTSPST